MAETHAYEQAALLSRNLPLVWDVTLFFLVSAVFLFFFFSALQFLTERRRRKVLKKKSAYITRVNEYVMFGRDNIDVKGKLDCYAMADAVAEVNNFLSPADRQKTAALLMAHDLDRCLLARYDKSRFSLRRKFLFSKMLFLFSPRLKPFFAKAMLGWKDIDLTEYAIYGFAMLAEDREDFERMTTALQAAYGKGISLKFSEFVYTQAFSGAARTEVAAYLLSVLRRDVSLAMVKSMVSAVGDLRDATYEPQLAALYERYRSDDQFVVTYIRALHKLGAEACVMIKLYYLSTNPVVRITCAKTGLDLCTPAVLKWLYIYFFDENYHVRKNLLEACRRHGIVRSEIVEIVAEHVPAKLEDPFFLDGLNAFYPEYRHDQ